MRSGFLVSLTGLVFGLEGQDEASDLACERDEAFLLDVHDLFPISFGFVGFGQGLF